MARLRRRLRSSNRRSRPSSAAATCSPARRRHRQTAGFTLPILQRLHTFYAEHRGAKRAVRALILTPTRELAAGRGKRPCVQQYLKLRSTVMFGGVSINPQIDALKRGVDIVVATPAACSITCSKTIDLSDLDILVLDEADRMLDMGFIHDIKRVLAKLPQRQNLLFSATFSDEIKALADSLLDSPALIEVARRNTTAESVAQKIHRSTATASANCSRT